MIARLNDKAKISSNILMELPYLGDMWLQIDFEIGRVCSKNDYAVINVQNLSKYRPDRIIIYISFRFI